MEVKDQDKAPNPNPINKIKFLGQGAYGCVYKPSIPCTNENTINISDKNISKLQAANSGSEREERIGKIITNNIPKFNTRYAPIIDSCDAKIEMIDPTEAKKCDILSGNPQDKPQGNPQDKPQELKSFKSPYAGKGPLGEHLLAVLKKSPKKIIKQMIETHIYILESIEKLNQLTPSIIHYDLKDNNIMFNNKTKKPIIIDFGLSLEYDPNKKYTDTELKEMYYVFYEKYPPWCIEIVLLSYMTQRIIGKRNQNLDTKITDENIERLKEICNIFVSENSIFQDTFTNTEQETMKIQLNTYVSEYRNEKWEKLFQDLQKSILTWDNYSVSVIYLFFMHDILNIKKNEENPVSKNPIIQTYVSILKSTIQTIPIKTPSKPPRKTPRETIEELKNMATTVNKKEYKRALHDLESILYNKKNTKQSMIQLNQQLWEQSNKPNQ
jgi:hypothetical protein